MDRWEHVLVRQMMEKKALTLGCLWTTLRKRSIALICQSQPHLLQSAECLKRTHHSFSIFSPGKISQNNNCYKTEQVLKLKMCWFNIKTVIFAPFMSKYMLDDKYIQYFNEKRSKNVWERWQTCTEFAGAEGPAGTAAVFQEKLWTNRRFSYSFLNQRRLIDNTKSSSHNREYCSESWC